MKLLNKILGIDIPTVEEIREQTRASIKEKQNEPSTLAYVMYTLLDDGNVNVKTEWSTEEPRFASVYAQLIHQISIGALEEGTINVLLQHGKNQVESQEFIGSVISKFAELKSDYKNSPIILPSRALAICHSKPGE